MQTHLTGALIPLQSAYYPPLMSSCMDATHTVPSLTLDPDTGAIRVALIPDIQRESHQTRTSTRRQWTPTLPLFTTHTTDFAPPDHLVGAEHLPIAHKGSLPLHAHLLLSGKNSTASRISAPTIGHPAMHLVTRPNEVTPNVPNASMLWTWPEGFPPATNVPTAMYSGSFPVNDEASPEFQGDHLPNQPQHTHIVCSPSTERSVPLSPPVSVSPLAPSGPGSSCRHPVPIEPGVILSDSKLHAFVLQIFSEPWFLNGQAERTLTDNEASSGLGFIGKSVFLAFASRLRDGPTRGGKWRCLICDTLPATLSNGKEYTTTREDRVLKHIRHHFGHRPWVCGGHCGIGDW